MLVLSTDALTIKQEKKREHDLLLESLGRPEVTEADIRSFIWLSAEEKEETINRYKRPEEKRYYFEDVKRRGALLHFNYTMPELQSLLQRLGGGPSEPAKRCKEIMTSKEWKKPVAAGKFSSSVFKSFLGLFSTTM